MSVDEILTLLAQGILLLIALATLIDFLRYRGWARFDIALMFGSLANIIVIQEINKLTGNPAPWSRIVGSGSLLAQPYLLLRLTDHFRRVPRSINGVALAGLGISIALLAFLAPPLPLVVVLAMVIYFIGIESYSSRAFIRGALDTGGVTRWRLLLAAIGSGLIAVVMLLAVVRTIWPDLISPEIPLVQLFVALASLSYYLGFSPPHWLRWTWQLSELHRFLTEARESEKTANPHEILKQLCQASNRAVGGLAAVAALWEDDPGILVVRARTSLESQPAGAKIVASETIERSGVISQAWADGQPLEAHTPNGFGSAEVDQLAKAAGAQSLLAVPIRTPGRKWGLMLAFLYREPLFVTDDLALLTLFAEQCAIALERIAMLDEHKGLIVELQSHRGHLEALVKERTAELTLANEQIERSEERYRLLAESTLTGVYLIQDGLFQYVNRALAALFGYRVEEIVGKLGPLDLTSPSDRDLVAENMEQRISGQMSDVRYSFQGMSKDGKLIDVEVHGSRIDHEDRPAVIGNLIDITERKRAEQQLRLMHAVALAASEAPDFNRALEASLCTVCEETIWVYGEAWVPNADDTALLCTPVWYSQMDGLEEFRETSMSLAFPPGIGLPGRVWASKRPVWIPDVTCDPSFLRSQVAQRAGLKAAVGLPALDGDKVVVVLVFFVSDVREQDEWLIEAISSAAAQLGLVFQRKRAEEEVHLLNEELEGRVLQRTAQLKAANEELEAFSYSVSHDLRAPLRAIDGFSRILLDDYVQNLEPEAHRYLRLVRDNAQQMGQLIDNLLSFSRLGRQEMRLETVEPAKIVEACLFELERDQRAKQVKVIIGNPEVESDGALPACQADPALLKQVYVNLLSNAFKFTSGREQPRVEVSWLPEGDSPFGKLGGPIYYVRDNGVGFDMRYASKLFGVFQRLHRAEDFEGTGVGLAIIQRIIHRHGGYVWAEAEVDRGATFYFTI